MNHIVKGAIDTTAKGALRCIVRLQFVNTKCAAHVSLARDVNMSIIGIALARIIRHLVEMMGCRLPP